jgi:hypothetical protein
MRRENGKFRYFLIRGIKKYSIKSLPCVKGGGPLAVEGLKAVIIELKRHHAEITKMMSQATI